VNAVVEASGLGKRYRRRWALADCTLAIPVGRVVGLVGPNGAGKTTLLQLAAGLLAPTAGTITVLGKRPGAPAQLRAVGFVAQDTPTYAGLSVAGHLRMGGWLNPGWDSELAERRVRQLGLNLRQRAGSLSGGQRAQLTRWLAVKLGVVGAFSIIAAGLLSLMVTWWSGPFDALGVTAGLLIRRTLPAMAVTVVIFAAVQFAVPLWVRPHLRQELTYQPASRYWALQWLETAIYLAGVLLLSGLCFLRIRRGRPAEGVRGRPGQPTVLQSWPRPAPSHQSA
jgi:ABC-type cobalamin transport system ATPase subunit